MPEWMVVTLGLAGLMTPVILAAMARDRTLLSMINQISADALAKVALVRDETIRLIDAQTGPLNDRVNRVRDEYVRRDDLQGHLARIEKQFDDLQAEMRRGNESQGKQLDDIRKLLTSSGRSMG